MPGLFLFAEARAGCAALTKIKEFDADLRRLIAGFAVARHRDFVGLDPRVFAGSIHTWVGG